MVADRLARVRARVQAAAAKAGRDAADVTLVAVSKGQPPEAILEAYASGQRDFGENRAAELAGKAPQLPRDIRWHFIGTLQTRQAKLARPHAFLLHSLDRERLVGAWAAGDTPSPALVQVNIAGETQKHGVEPGSVAGLIEHAERLGVQCVGLMTIPPISPTPEDSRHWFAMLSELRDDLVPDWPRLTHLSMGMTDDYEVAIDQGATLIRVGRAIFEEPGTPARID